VLKAIAVVEFAVFDTPAVSNVSPLPLSDPANRKYHDEFPCPHIANPSMAGVEFFNAQHEKLSVFVLATAIVPQSM
jgi:hypothetical protein